MQSLFNIQNLSFAYGKNSVFTDLQLELERGTFYGLIGANGSGKSTLLELLTGGLSATSGTVRFMDKEIRHYSKQELAKIGRAHV